MPEGFSLDDAAGTVDRLLDEGFEAIESMLPGGGRQTRKYYPLSVTRKGDGTVITFGQVDEEDGEIPATFVEVRVSLEVVPAGELSDAGARLAAFAATQPADNFVYRMSCGHEHDSPVPLAEGATVTCSAHGPAQLVRGVFAKTAR